MTEVVARIKIMGKNFETLVDLDKSLNFKNGRGIVDDAIVTDMIFDDVKKGLRVSEDDLMKAFKTKDTKEVISRIIKNGEVQKPLEYLRKEQEGKTKQVIDFLAKNAVGPTGIPYTAERIKTALEEAGVNIENRPVEEQINKLLEKLKAIIPIKIETKRIKLKVPPIYTGKVYGLIKDYKEKEEWIGDGSLICIVNIPVGLQMEFYDKLNSITHGVVITEEVKE